MWSLPIFFQFLWETFWNVAFNFAVTFGRCGYCEFSAIVPQQWPRHIRDVIWSLLARSFCVSGQVLYSLILLSPWLGSPTNPASLCLQGVLDVGVFASERVVSITVLLLCCADAGVTLSPLFSCWKETQLVDSLNKAFTPINEVITPYSWIHVWIAQIVTLKLRFQITLYFIIQYIYMMPHYCSDLQSPTWLWL